MWQVNLPASRVARVEIERIGKLQKFGERQSFEDVEHRSHRASAGSTFHFVCEEANFFDVHAALALQFLSHQLDTQVTGDAVKSTAIDNLELFLAPVRNINKESYGVNIGGH